MLFVANVAGIFILALLIVIAWQAVDYATARPGRWAEALGVITAAVVLSYFVFYYLFMGNS